MRYGPEDLSPRCKYRYLSGSGSGLSKNAGSGSVLNQSGSTILLFFTSTVSVLHVQWFIYGILKTFHGLVSCAMGNTDSDRLLQVPVPRTRGPVATLYVGSRYGTNLFPLYF
jgi:hypothetical protein